MSNTNDFLPFASTDTGTNLIEQAAWVTSTARLVGNVPGIASSAFNNKALRQCTYMVSQIAQFISNTLGQDVLDNATPSTLLTQIGQAFSIPSGTVMPYAGSSAPAGYLFTDGSVVSQTTYANLYAVIGTLYNTGSEGSGNFRLPDLRGIFIRGAGTNAHLQNANGAYFASALGTYQNDEMQGHIHQTSVSVLTGTSAPVLQNGSGGGNAPTLFNAVNTNGPLSDGSNGSPRVGVESRPANLTLNHIIKT